MSLPQIVLPEYTLTVPTSGETLKYRPYLVKEEKLLLMAQASGDPLEIVNAVKTIVKNCVKEFGEKDVDQLPAVDLEYIFLKIRSVSVSNVVQLAYKDSEDEKIYNFTVNLDEINVIRHETHSPLIKITEDITLRMKYPSFAVTEKLKTLDSEIDIYFNLIRECMEKIYNDKEEFNTGDYSKEELEEFILNLPPGSLEKIQKFFETQPKMYHQLSYTNSKGNERVIELETLTDFFNFW